MSNLRPCNACGKSVAKDARTCPHCGKNDPTGHYQWRSVQTLLVVIIIVIAFVFVMKF